MILNPLMTQISPKGRQYRITSVEAVLNKNGYATTKSKVRIKYNDGTAEILITERIGNAHKPIAKL